MAGRRCSCRSWRCWRAQALGLRCAREHVCVQVPVACEFASWLVCVHMACACACIGVQQEHGGWLGRHEQQKCMCVRGFVLQRCGRQARKQQACSAQAYMRMHACQHTPTRTPLQARSCGGRACEPADSEAAQGQPGRQHEHRRQAMARGACLLLLMMMMMRLLAAAAAVLLDGTCPGKRGSLGENNELWCAKCKCMCTRGGGGHWLVSLPLRAVPAWICNP